MALRRLSFPVRTNPQPDQAGYSHGDPSEARAVKFDGGTSRFRRTAIGSSYPLSCQWTLCAVDAAEFERFYRVAAGRGSIPFIVPLVVEDAACADYEVHIIPGSWQKANAGGRNYRVTVALEVKPNASDTGLDLAILALFDAYEGYGFYDVLPLLSRVLETMPT